MTLNLVDLPVLTLGVYGITLGDRASVLLGSFPLPDPSERQEVIKGVLSYIDLCRKEETLCIMKNLAFDPTSFDYFSVTEIQKETEQ